MAEYPRAKIDHTCTACGDVIHKGSRYVRRKLRSLDYIEKYHYSCKPDMKICGDYWKRKFKEHINL